MTMPESKPESKPNENEFENEATLNPDIVTLSSDQQRAFDDIIGWINTKPNLELSLGGYAGTGKTTLINQIINHFDNLNVCIMAFTGKAVSVLNRKGVNAQTIHSTIYYVRVVNKKPIFTLKPDIGNIDLIIVDEASMISTEVYKDLKSFRIPILWVGDHGQLEPIGDNPGIMKNPDLRLEIIHRQAAENPIIAFADAVRKGKIPTPNHDGVIRKSQIEDFHINQTDQIICGLNRTRVKMNRFVRKTLGLDPKLPQPGDKLVCLKNNRFSGVFNGLQGTLDELQQTTPEKHLATITTELGFQLVTPIYAKQFDHPKGLCDTPKNFDRFTTHWDYAYAVTCHKAQGSEWDSVLVLDERAGKLWSMNRWRYTAITRASNKLVYAV